MTKHPTPAELTRQPTGTWAADTAGALWQKTGRDTWTNPDSNPLPSRALHHTLGPIEILGTNFTPNTRSTGHFATDQLAEFGIDPWDL